MNAFNELKLDRAFSLLLDTLMQKHLDKITPNVSDTWTADELFLKVRGMKYLYALLDDETRFWIAKEIADSK